MRYRIEYDGDQPYDFVNNRSELLKRLQDTSNKIVDIRKVYKSGSTDSVTEGYRRFLGQKSIGRSE